MFEIIYEDTGKCENKKCPCRNAKRYVDMVPKVRSRLRSQRRGILGHKRSKRMDAPRRRTQSRNAICDAPRSRRKKIELS